MTLLQYVNPLQGTASVHSYSNGNTLPLISRPWGMTSWSPQTGEERKGWFYHPAARHFQGLRLTHQPSPWIYDYGHLVFMPQSGPLYLAADDRASSFRPEETIIKPDYCKINLLRYETSMELVPAMRSAMMRLNFTHKDNARFIISPFEGKSTISFEDETFRVSGSTSAHHGDVPENFAMYYVIEFDCPIIPEQSGTFDQHFATSSQLERQGEQIGAFVGLNLPESGVVHVRIGTSFISKEQALLNMHQDSGDKDFNTLRQEARQEWEKQLSVIEVESDDEDRLKTFYTSLYRTCLFPRTWHEYDPEGNQVHYSPFDGKVHSGPMYVDIGLWDIFRTNLPLYSLLYPSLLSEMMEGWVNAYKESGWLPKWLSPAERSMMPGTLIDAAMADAYVKGIEGFDIETAYEGLRKHALTESDDDKNGRTGLEAYKRYGYLPHDQFKESVSNSLDYHYGDFAIAQIAKGLGYYEDYAQLMERAKNYAMIFDPQTGFMRGKDRQGQWREPFDQYEWGGPYCEGGPWQCSWSVPHDILGLAHLMGGKEAFIARLDELMTSPPIFRVGTYDREIHEMSEMAAVDFGQFAISNQPSFHIPYIYTVLGKPSSTQYWVRKTLEELFSSEPDGLPGDEDNGSLGAWYIWGALGLYPFCPGVPEYVIGSPLFDKVTIRLEHNKQIVIEANNHGPDHVYWDELTVDGQKWDKLYVQHEQLAKGAHLQFNMTDQADENIVNDHQALPYSMSQSI